MSKFKMNNQAIRGVLFLLLFSVIKVSAQDITFNVKSYKGGYNVSCNGSTDGSIDATIVGLTPTAGRTAQLPRISAASLQVFIHLR
jgi:hypothetical protein